MREFMFPKREGCIMLSPLVLDTCRETGLGEMCFDGGESLGESGGCLATSNVDVGKCSFCQRKVER